MSIISFSDTCGANKAIEQKTTGDKSPNIYAPGAKNITINYFVEKQGKSEKDVELLKKEVERQNATNEQRDAAYQDLMKAYEKLKRDVENGKKIEPLIKFTHQEFIDNFVTLKTYYQYRMILKLLNPDMLVELLNVYFRSVLLYPSNSMKKYYITASDGRLLLLQIEGHNEKGEKLFISIPDISGSLLEDVCADFIKSATPKHYERIVNLFDCALDTPELEKVHKFNILDARHFILKHKLLLNM
jgi:hypothetical protein